MGSAMEALDSLFLPIGHSSFKEHKERKPQGMNFLARIWHNVGVMIAICCIVAAAGAYALKINPLSMIGGAFSTQDVRALLEDEGDLDMVTLYNQYRRYCEPTVLHRIGNGFDAATCQEKLDAMVAHRAESRKLAYTGPSADITLEVQANEKAFREGLGNISKVEAQPKVDTQEPPVPYGGY